MGFYWSVDMSMMGLDLGMWHGWHDQAAGGHLLRILVRPTADACPDILRCQKRKQISKHQKVIVFFILTFC